MKFKTITSKLIESGTDIKYWYRSDKDMKRKHILFKYTDEEIQEYKKCKYGVTTSGAAHNPILRDVPYLSGIQYFYKTYINYSISDEQDQILHAMDTSRFLVMDNNPYVINHYDAELVNCVYVLYYNLFNVDKVTYIASIDVASSNKLSDTLKELYKALPFFLKPGVIAWNKNRISFDVGNTIITNVASKHSGIGHHVHLLYLHEFSEVSGKISEDIYKNLYPVFSAGKTDKMFVSGCTMIPHNQIYVDLLSKDNDFTKIRV